MRLALDAVKSYCAGGLTPHRSLVRGMMMNSLSDRDKVIMVEQDMDKVFAGSQVRHS